MSKYPKCDDLDNLEQKILKYLWINAGWKLSGGICIDTKFGYMFQAIYKFE